MAEEILVKMPADGQYSITMPAMGTCATKHYAADDGGMYHFKPEEKVHADHANDLFRNADRAHATLQDRAALMAAKAPGAGEAASAARDSNLAAVVSATVMGLMPEMMKQMREEIMKQIAANPGPAGPAGETGETG